MLTAVVARSPRFGGVVKSFDATGAKAIDGVVDVVSIGSGVVVLANDTWSAIKGREASRSNGTTVKRKSAPAIRYWRTTANSRNLRAFRRFDAAMLKQR